MSFSESFENREWRVPKIKQNNNLSDKLYALSRNISSIKAGIENPLTETNRTELRTLLDVTIYEISTLKTLININNSHSQSDKKLGKVFSDLLYEFKPLPLRVENKLKSYERQRALFELSGDPQNPISRTSSPTPSEKNLLLECTLRQNQLENEIDYNEIFIQERENDIVGISEGIAELNNIFTSLHKIVGEQGSMIDNIEVNVENVAVNAMNANNEFVTANKTQRKSRKHMCWIFLILFFIFLVALVILV